MKDKKIYDSVTRKEVLDQPVSMCTPSGLKTKECEPGDIVDAIYSYDCTLKYLEDVLDELDIAFFENVVKSLFLKYGDDCLNLNFLNFTLREEGDTHGHVVVTSVEVSKVYKLTVKKMRGGCTEYQSRTYRLKPENTETQGLTNK